jgi:ribosome biogenesis ATPase
VRDRLGPRGQRARSDRRPLALIAADYLERICRRRASVRWSDLVGHDEQKRVLGVMAAQVRLARRLSREGVQLSSGIVMSGLPGSGRTSLATAFARSARRRLYLVPPGVADPAFVRAVYDALDGVPSVLVWRGADPMVCRSRVPNAEALAGAVLDGVWNADPETGPVSVVLISSSLRAVDPALVAPRLLRPIPHLNLPSPEERMVLLRLGLGPSADLPEEELRRIAERCEGMTFGQIAEACSRAANCSCI